MFLLGLVYAVVIGALIATGARGVTLAVVAGGLFLLQFLASDKLALRAMGPGRSAPRSSSAGFPVGQARAAGDGPREVSAQELERWFPPWGIPF